MGKILLPGQDDLMSQDAPVYLVAFTMGSGTILRESGGRAGSDLATRNKQNASTHGT